MPATTYQLRFGAKNRVGFSQWGADQEITTPKRGKPEPPILSKRTSEGEIVDGDIIELSSPDRYQVFWDLPEDNGLSIDYFQLTTYPVILGENEERWVRNGDIVNSRNIFNEEKEIN